MKLPSGAYCLIRSKHVCQSQDVPSPNGPAPVPAGLKPHDHHWLTIMFDLWDSETDQLAGKRPVLTDEAQFGHRLAAGHPNLGDFITETIDAHYRGGHRGNRCDPRWHPSNAVADVLGLLQHPHVQALKAMAQ